MKHPERQHQAPGEVGKIQQETWESVDDIWGKVGTVGSFVSANIRGLTSAGFRTLRSLFTRRK